MNHIVANPDTFATLCWLLQQLLCMHTVTTCRAPKFRSDVSVVQLPSPICSFCCPISKPYLKFLLSNFQALSSVSVLQFPSPIFSFLLSNFQALYFTLLTLLYWVRLWLGYSPFSRLFHVVVLVLTSLLKLRCRSSVSVVQFPSPDLSAKFCSKLGLRPTCDYYYEIYYCIPKWLALNRRVLVYHRQVMSHEMIRSILWDYFLWVCLLQAILHNKGFSDQGYTALQSQYL